MPAVTDEEHSIFISSTSNPDFSAIEYISSLQLVL